MLKGRILLTVKYACMSEADIANEGEKHAEQLKGQWFDVYVTPEIEISGKALHETEFGKGGSGIPRGLFGFFANMRYLGSKA